MVNSSSRKGEVCTATSAMIASRRASQQLGMEQLEEELTCPVCCGLFDDPRVLLCSHSFCKKCLEGLLEGPRGAAFRTPLRCPTCRKETPHSGAHGLQVNYSLRAIVDKYSRLKGLPRMSECGRHCGQPLNIFCATDLRLICGFCATTDEHRGHEFCSMEEAYEREKGAFEELCRRVTSWQGADVVSRLETLQSGKKKALQSVSSDAEKVRDYFDTLVGSLECKRNEILSDFETLKLVVLQAYDPEITKLSAVMDEHRRALGIAESFRGISEPLCFLQQMQEFREKLGVLKTPPVPSRKDVNLGPPVRNFDVRKWDSLRLREVDKISVPHESGSYRTGGPRGASHPRLLLLLAAGLLLLALALSLALALPPRMEPLLAALSSHLGCTGAYLRRITEACAALIGAGEAGVAELLDSTVGFLGGLQLF